MNYIYMNYIYIFIFLWKISYPELIFPPNPPKNNNGLRPWLLPQTQLPIAHHLPPCESLRNAIRGTISNCSSPAWSRKAVRWYCEGGNKQQRARNRNNRVKIGHPVGQQKCLKKRFTAGAAYSLIDICTSHYLYTVYHFHEGFVYCHLLPMWNANESVQCRYSMVQ